ncbi:activator-dependent family glycosyltransferase [Amycolatopsis sp. MEPSY49]|uniref:activator-dependent family glycosyltransferase n=1 Tax=Amycolatopsis sp. MEPSY49 TaxID=3151600 RepID=UPI003EF55632
MRVLFVTLDEKSHLYCMVPTAWALVAAGHEVRVAASPGFTDVVTATGLTAVPVGADNTMHEGMKQNRDAQEADIANWNDTDPASHTWAALHQRYTFTVWAGFAIYNDEMVADLVAHARDWRPDLVVWDALTYAGAIAAKACGAAHVRQLCWADVWCAMRRTFLEVMAEQPLPEQEDPLYDWLELTGRPYGVDFDEELVTGQATIDPLPESLGARSGVRRLPVRHVPYNGRAVVWDWLREPPSRPRVCLTLGSSNTDAFGGDYVSIPDMLAALSTLDIEVIAALVPAQRKVLDEVPANVRVVESVALHTVLPSCAAIVHHGGFGSYGAALVAGVPQLTVTTPIADHLLRAQRLVDEGAGLLFTHNGFTADDLRTSVARLVGEPGFRVNALRLRDLALAQPTPHELVAELEKLVAEMT